MGNLRQKYTDEEWDDLESRIKEDKIDGKPDSSLIYLSFGGLPLHLKINIRDALIPFYDGFDLREMNAWIEWDKKSKLKNYTK